MGETPHFSFLFLWRFLWVLLTLIIVLVLIDALFHGSLGFFLKLLVIHAIKDIFFDCCHYIRFQFFFKLLLFDLFFFFLLLLLSPPLLNFIDVLLVLALEVFICLRHLVFGNLDQGLELVCRVAPSHFELVWLVIVAFRYPLFYLYWL